MRGFCDVWWSNCVYGLWYRDYLGRRGGLYFYCYEGEEVGGFVAAGWG